MSNHHHHHQHRHHRRGYGGYNNYNMDPDMDQDYDQGGANESEFNYESNYEMAPGFELNENENEYNPSYEAEGEGENELENVTNEQEFEHWVHGLARGYGNLHGILRHPLGRMAIRHFGRIAPAVVRGLGYRRGGWRGGLGGNDGRGYYNNRYWRHHGGDAVDAPPSPSPSYVDGGSSPAAPGGDSTDSFKNFVLGTLQNLSQQVASGNDTVNALKSSMANSAAANMPSIAQPAGDPSAGGPGGPGGAGGAGGAAPQSAGGQGAGGQGGQPQQGAQEFERYGPYYGSRSDGEVTDRESSFGEETEMELASELLSVNNEQELDHFLGDLFKKAVGAVGGLLGGGSGGAGGILKNVLGGVVKKVLPLAGTAAGTFFGGPIGAAIGGNLGQMASGLFEMELEGLSSEDREFETARAVVRFAGNAARQLADNQTNDPQEDVRRAVIEAAGRFAPGLLADDRSAHHHRHHHHNGHHHHHGEHHHHDEHHHHGEHHHSGTWFRRGDKIIIENI